MTYFTHAIVQVFFFFSVFLTVKNEEQSFKSVNSFVERDSINNEFINKSQNVIHILVALCDNKYQGIVPVPKGIGNGQDPKNNLYWGCAYGVKTYFKKSANWKLISTELLDSVKMERLVFKHVSQESYVVADAYNGKYIKECTIDFLKSCSGQLKETITVGDKVLGINGNSNLVGYIGHDGLMDFTIDDEIKNIDHNKRDCIILACYSKSFFSSFISKANVNPLVWTTGLMAPEAYTIHDAINQYCNGGNESMIIEAAAKAYAKYQKCSEKSAKRLLVAGW
ncbi:hypothetical protein [Flavobacterium sp. J27]|uniref:hypothetical protein n=1 Tax=Flavobacterium sp. J27 TaxID=2060419 RepID=UPI00197ABC8D|nr:hypothetical protein [Flavobacterium sp. J27]